MAEQNAQGDGRDGGEPVESPEELEQRRREKASSVEPPDPMSRFGGLSGEKRKRSDLEAHHLSNLNKLCKSTKIKLLISWVWANYIYIYSILFVPTSIIL